MPGTRESRNKHYPRELLSFLPSAGTSQELAGNGEFSKELYKGAAKWAPRPVLEARWSLCALCK